MTENQTNSEAPSPTREGASLRPPCTKCGINERAKRGSWCSPCRNEAQREYNKRTRRRPVRLAGQCVICGKPFEYSSAYPRIYCSTRCNNQAKATRTSAARRAAMDPARRAEIAERSALSLQGMKRCAKCRDVKTHAEFGIRGAGRQSYCLECMRYYDPPSGRTSRTRSWTSHLKRKYKLSIEAWTAMLIAQSGRCGICEKPMDNPHVDHDHDCCSGNGPTCGQCIRGLLCGSCNPRIHQGIDLEWLMAAARYLGLTP